MRSRQLTIASIRRRRSDRYSVQHQQPPVTRHNVGADVPRHYPRSGSPRIPYMTSPNAISVVGTTIASNVKKIAA